MGQIKWPAIVVSNLFETFIGLYCFLLIQRQEWPANKFIGTRSAHQIPDTSHRIWNGYRRIADGPEPDPELVPTWVLLSIKPNEFIMFHIAQGTTSPQTHPGNWVDYNTNQASGFYIDVDTSNCGFTETPHYLISIEGARGYHWYLSGLNCIYNQSPNGFRVYLRWTDAPSDFNTIGNTNEANSLRVKTARDKGWSLKWTGIQVCPCNPKEANPQDSPDKPIQE